MLGLSIVAPGPSPTSTTQVQHLVADLGIQIGETIAEGGEGIVYHATQLDASSLAARQWQANQLRASRHMLPTPPLRPRVGPTRRGLMKPTGPVRPTFQRI